MPIRQISVFLKNEKGALQNCLSTLANANVDLRALCLADTQNYGILRVIVRGHDTAVDTLKTAGYLVSLNDVIAAEIPDRPGGLSNVIDILADAGINVEYTYAFLMPSDKQACVVLRVDDNDSAESTLQRAGIQTLSRCEGDLSPL